jgi:hypothetical protein
MTPAKVLSIFTIALAALVAWLCIEKHMAAKKNEKAWMTIAALNAENAGLRDLSRGQAAALAQVRLEATQQAERLAKAQADAAKARLEAEGRIRDLMAAQPPGDPAELILWALAEAQKMKEALK